MTRGMSRSMAHPGLKTKGGERVPVFKEDIGADGGSPINSICQRKEKPHHPAKRPGFTQIGAAFFQIKPVQLVDGDFRARHFPESVGRTEMVEMSVGDKDELQLSLQLPYFFKNFSVVAQHAGVDKKYPLRGLDQVALAHSHRQAVNGYPRRFGTRRLCLRRPELVYC